MHVAYLLALVSLVCAMAGLANTGLDPSERDDVAEIIAIEDVRQYQTKNSTETRYTYRVSGAVDGAPYTATVSTSDRRDIGDEFDVIVQESDQTVRLGVTVNKAGNGVWWAALGCLAAAIVIGTLDQKIMDWNSRRPVTTATAGLAGGSGLSWRLVLVGSLTIGSAFLAGQVRLWTNGPAVIADVIEAEAIGANSGVDLVVSTTDGQVFEVNIPLLVYEQNPDSVTLLTGADPVIVHHDYLQAADRWWMLGGFLLGLTLYWSLPRMLQHRHRSSLEVEPALTSSERR